MVWNGMIPPVKPAAEENDGSTERSGTGDHDEADEIVRIAKDMCLQIVSDTTRVLVAADAAFGPVFNTLLTAQTGIVAASFLLSGNLVSTREEDMLLQIMHILVRCSRQRNLVKGVTRMLLKTAETRFAANKDGAVSPGGVSEAVVEQLTEIVKDLLGKNETTSPSVPAILITSSSRKIQTFNSVRCSIIMPNWA
jgi:phenylpyruvate tautomerase PptA (4-oxalocrotonate tautomerase family)